MEEAKNFVSQQFSEFIWTENIVFLTNKNHLSFLQLKLYVACRDFALKENNTLTEVFSPGGSRCYNPSSCNLISYLSVDVCTGNLEIMFFQIKDIWKILNLQQIGLERAVAFCYTLWRHLSLFLENSVRKAITVNNGYYRLVIAKFFWPRLYDQDTAWHQ